MIYITAFLFVKKGKEAVFKTYESLVLPILNTYNGTLIYRMRPTQENFVTFEDDLPYEVHFISFNSDEDFMSFINDEERKRFNNLKEDSIRSTFITKGKKI